MAYNRSGTGMDQVSRFFPQKIGFGNLGAIDESGGLGGMGTTVFDDYGNPLEVGTPSFGDGGYTVGGDYVGDFPLANDAPGSSVYNPVSVANAPGSGNAQLDSMLSTVRQLIAAGSQVQADIALADLNAKRSQAGLQPLAPSQLPRNPSTFKMSDATMGWAVGALLTVLFLSGRNRRT